MRYFQAEYVLDVKHINRPLAVCRGTSGRDGKPKIGKRHGHVVQQATTVTRVHFDHGEDMTGCVVDNYTGRHLEDLGSAGNTFLAGQRFAGMNNCGESIFQRGFQLGQSTLIIERLADGILNPERIERHSVIGREDLGGAFGVVIGFIID